MSVLTASKWNEKSMENYVVSFSNGRQEVHGYFSGRLLSALGWEHSSNAVTKVKNIDGSIIVANGTQGNLFGALSLDNIYSKLFEDREYPDLIQYPVYYYTNESINLVPAN